MLGFGKLTESSIERGIASIGDLLSPGFIVHGGERWNSMTRAWPPSKARLDELRRVGDEEADALVAAMFAARGAEGVKTLVQSLFAYELDEERLPDEAIEFLARSREMRPDVEVTAGQDVFQELGPEILLILGCYSLPAAYAATRGARVLSQTGFLTEDTDRRLAETSQMVLDVMSAGGLTPTGRGVRAAEKVRLMHAAIRHLIMGRTDQPWDQPENGLPINQEDLAATLMTFSYLVVDGLRKLGFSVTSGEAEDYLEAWKLVGRLMGVLPGLIPANFAEAQALTERIEQRQIAPGKVGRSLLTALLRALTPSDTRCPWALMRRMFPGPVADGLGVPRHTVRDGLVLALTSALRLLDPLLRLFGTVLVPSGCSRWTCCST